MVSVYALALASFVSATPSVAQDAAPRYTLALAPCQDAVLTPWPADVEPGSLPALEVFYQGQGYLAAAAQWMAPETACLTPGPRYLLAIDHLVTRSPEDSVRARQILADARGLLFTGASLDSLAGAVLLSEERQGRIGSTVRYTGLSPRTGSIGVGMEIVPGPQPVLVGVLISGAQRTRPSYLERLTGLRPGSRLQAFDAPAIRRKLVDSGLFDQVQLPRLLASGDSAAVVQLILQDRSPGAFDLAMGYLPGVGGRTGSVVGSGNIHLRNLFGAGRSLQVALDRLPARSSSFEVHLADPFVLGQNLGAEASFSGYQQDSTFSRQEYRAGVSLRSGPTTVTGVLMRQSSRPGSGGLALVNGEQRIAQTRSRSGGLGLRFSALDDPINPSSGVFAEAQVLRGRSLRTLNRLEASGGAADTVLVTRRILQDRLEARFRAYLPLSPRVVLVGGADFRTLVSDEVDAADLYRLGGASTLRGYDEDRFAGKTVGRGLVELRRQQGGVSYAYTFIDLGLVSTAGAGESSGWYPGYGLGVQLETAAGLLNVSYAINSEDGPLAGRIHFGIAFGL